MNSSPLTPIHTPSESDQGSSTKPFAQRKDSGKVMESLNEQLTSWKKLPVKQDICELSLNVDPAKYQYRTMYQKLMGASEGMLFIMRKEKKILSIVLDDRIDSFAQLLQEYHKITDEEFSNPAQQSMVSYHVNF